MHGTATGSDRIPPCSCGAVVRPGPGLPTECGGILRLMSLTMKLCSFGGAACDECVMMKCVMPVALALIRLTPHPRPFSSHTIHSRIHPHLASRAAWQDYAERIRAAQLQARYEQRLKSKANCLLLAASRDAKNSREIAAMQMLAGPRASVPSGKTESAGRRDSQNAGTPSPG